MFPGFFRKKAGILSLVFSAVLVLSGCGAKSPAAGASAAGEAVAGATAAREAGANRIAVFIPGVMSGSPIYEMLAAGVNRAAAEQPGVTVNVIEGGFNQAEWEPRISALAASGVYGLIVSSNPSLPAIAQSVSANFPEQNFLLLDGEVSGNPHIYTLRYNQEEQAFMAGHIAALVTLELSGESAAEGAVRRVGLVAGQEYPAMNNIILPGYLAGARAVDPGFTADFRVVGNWFDAGTGALLAADMIRGGTAVILCVAGGANEGVVQAASEAGAKVVWFDTNGYDIRPGTVVGSSVLYQDRAAYEQTKRYLAGTLPFGSAEMVGVADGFVDFVEDDPHYVAAVSPEIRAKQAELIQKIRSGE
ncbi:MAG: BMP family ABC transporter substrate-binding protein [Spirochaetaceae bacterium]|jgi:simple sugar transport system substrate-binding protein|nr:BMP family ABC transporter substrate-binding protein [Spirochaetaceae bacterium]